MFKNSPKHIRIQTMLQIILHNFDGYCCLLSSVHFRPLGHISLLLFFVVVFFSFLFSFCYLFHLDYLNVGLCEKYTFTIPTFQQYHIALLNQKFRSFHFECFIVGQVAVGHFKTCVLCRILAGYWLLPVDTITDKMEIIIKEWFSFHILYV